jgi:hypothetical protein
MPPDQQYRVRAACDERTKGNTFGDFDSHAEAEQCVIALAGRADVLSAIIEEVE